MEKAPGDTYNRTKKQGRDFEKTFMALDLVECLTPIFMSKMQYALSLICDPNLHRCCNTVKHLQKLQNEAMRVILGKRLADKVTQQSLLQQCNQTSVRDHALRAHYNLSWSLLSSPCRRTCSGLERRLDFWQKEKSTRQNLRNSFPKQQNKDTLLSRLTECWNILPEDIKNTKKKEQATYKIKCLF